MDHLCGYPVLARKIPVGGHDYTILGPGNYEDLIDDPRVIARFKRDEFMPYWAEFWPAARLLAEEVAAWGPAPPVDPPRVLEFGCGLGLIGLVAHRLGYTVTLSDYERDTLEFVRASAVANNLAPPATAYVDWREDYPELRSDRILAAEVLYERRNLDPIARFIKAHLLPNGFALLVDGNRQTADAFPDVAAAHGLAAHQRPIERTFPDLQKTVCGRFFEVYMAARVGE